MSMLGLERLGPQQPEEDEVIHRRPGESTQPVAKPVRTITYDDAPAAPSSRLTAAPPPRPDSADVAARLQLLLGNRLQVVDTLAVGGMASIFRLQHRLHGGPFVAKVLHPDLASRPSVLHSFRTEAIHASRIGSHPNAVPVFDFGELDGLFFMLMPFIEGEDLDRLVERSGPLQPAEVLQLAAQMSSLLSHAESLGIVHCDVTPGNIRLDIFGNYRLLDFGISQSSSPDKGALQAGTPFYASPEQLLGKPLDVRSDLYSLGTVLAEALTAKPLFHGASMAEIKRKHLEGDWQMPANLQEGEPLARLLRLLLATDASERLASAFELSGILDALGHARPEFRTKPVVAQSAAAPPARRRLSE